MMRRLWMVLGCWLGVGISLAHGQPKPDFQDAKVLSKIAFGSCFDPRDRQSSIFDGILKQQPDVFIFLGDNIYGDTNDMEVLQKKYAELEAVDGFRKLRDSTTIVATWDDHDYGINDGGKSYAKRVESQQIFVDFFKDPQDSPRRKRDGIYASYCFGPPGKTCQILLLDTRYFRDELPRVKAKPAPECIGWYEPTSDASKTLLGDAQWKWLEEQLMVPADVRIIASSIQVLAYEKGMENWGHVPHEQKRLFELLKKHQADHTFAISGDVHFAEFSKQDIGGYPFYDFTSSGMSHTAIAWAHARNPLRIGDPTWEMNAGLIEIDWASNRIDLAAINPQGEKVITKRLELSELKFR